MRGTSAKTPENQTRGEHIGAPLTERRLGPFRLVHWAASSRHIVEPHGHYEPHFIWTLAGTFITGVSAEPCGPGSLIFNAPQTYHADQFAYGRGAFVSLTLVDDALLEIIQYGLPSAPRLAQTPDGDLLMTRLMGASAGPDPDAFHLESLCHELFGAVCSARPEDYAAPSWLARARDRLRDDEAGSVIEAAAAVGVHPVHLTRTFRRFHGCTPGEYQRAWRLRRAAALLLDTRLSLAQIAVDSGFCDQSHLTRQFRSFYGVGPAHYRRLMS